MVFNNYIPEPPIARHIESIFHFKDHIPDHTIERVVPTGHIFLIFELDGIQRNTFDNDTLKPQRSFTKVWISGMQTGCITISAHKHSEMFVIQFKPTGTYPFFHVPIHTLSNRIIPAEENFGNEIFILRESILSKGTSNEKFSKVEGWLRKRFDNWKEPPGELLNMFGRLHEEPVTNFPEAMKRYPHTPKHLINQFKKYIGLTPKAYFRIIRFNEILRTIHNNQKINWSRVAYLCGYTDQSYFIKEFKHFSGFSPKDFINRNFHKVQPNFFPVDR